MLCFGITNFSPEKVLEFLMERGTIRTAADVSIIPAGKKLLGNRPKRKVVFIMSIGDLGRNLRVLNDKIYSGVQVFIFASPLRINELKGCTALDMQHDVGHRGIGFNTNTRLSVSRYNYAIVRPETAVSVQDAMYLKVLSERMKHGSLLTPLMTFVYTLPRATHQTPVKLAAARYLYGVTSLPSFIAETDRLLAGKNLDKVLEILESDIGVAYRNAFKELKSKEHVDKTNIKALCKKWNVSDYEIRYLMSVIHGLKLTKTKR